MLSNQEDFYPQDVRLQFLGGTWKYPLKHLNTKCYSRVILKRAGTSEHHTQYLPSSDLVQK